MRWGVGAATRGGAALIDELRDDKKGVNLGRVARNSLAGAAEAYTAMTMFAGLKVGIDQGGTGTQIAKTSLKAMKGNIRSDIKALKYGAIRAIARLLPGMGSPAPVDVMCAGENGSGKRFKYEHNPSDNPKVLEDAIEDPDAVYGYRPREDGSLSRFTAKKYDWTDPVAVEGYRQERIEYHNRNEAGAQRIVKEMTAAGASIEDIAIKVNEYRNQSRIDAFVNPDGSISDMNGYNNALERAQIRSYENLIKAGKSPEEIIKSAIKGCPGMDACTGLYDEYYDTY